MATSTQQLKQTNTKKRIRLLSIRMGTMEDLIQQGTQCKPTFQALVLVH